MDYLRSEKFYLSWTRFWMYVSLVGLVLCGTGLVYDVAFRDTEASVLLPMDMVTFSLQRYTGLSPRSSDFAWPLNWIVAAAGWRESMERTLALNAHTDARAYAYAVNTWIRSLLVYGLLLGSIGVASGTLDIWRIEQSHARDRVD